MKMNTRMRRGDRIVVPALIVCVIVFGLRAEALPLPADQSKNDFPANGFIYATYLVGGKIKNRAQLDEMRFDPFDFIYLVAEPDWKTEDFDLPENEAMSRLVRNHSYPVGDSGSALVPELIDRAHQNKVKVLVSIRGSRQGAFLPVVSDDRKRGLFARVMAAFVKKYGYDGIEIDWEETIDINKHTMLMTDLRLALNAVAKTGGTPLRTYFLTTALQTFKIYSPEQARRLCGAVDWVNIMTYDMGGGNWGRTPNHNTPLNGMRAALDKWSVFPRNKICIGLANYGYRYKGLAPGQTSETSLSQCGRDFAYIELPKLLECGWTESYDAMAEVPYYFSPDKTEFASIDNARSLSCKMEWVFEMRYGGVFWWEFHHDYFPPDAEHAYSRHPLIDSVSDEIRAREQEACARTP